MVDVAGKPSTHRVAVASGRIRMLETTANAISQGRLDKGDVLSVARIAGIMSAKRTDQMIPLCHSLPLESVSVEFDFPTSQELRVLVTVSTTGPTGVEMEALHAASVALLTVYDMCKAVDRGMQVTQIQLETKSGGRSGTWQRSNPEPGESSTPNPT